LTWQSFISQLIKYEKRKIINNPNFLATLLESRALRGELLWGLKNLKKLQASFKHKN
jgi:hypothetical protein